MGPSERLDAKLYTRGIAMDKQYAQGEVSARRPVKGQAQSLFDAIS
jgi:hypothetical protein